MEYSDWAAPIVAVPKKDDTMRVCSNYKVTINPVLQIDQYLVSSPSTLAGEKKFTKLDLTSAYQQMILDEDSAKLVTLNIQQGLYRCTYLLFSVASAPAVFQCKMDRILQGVSKGVCYIDDILVTGDSEKQHLQNLEEVLPQLKDNGLRLNCAKCSFFQGSVKYLGRRIDAQGVHTADTKVKAIREALPPQNINKLHSF